MLGCLYRCVHPRFLAILIALKSKDVVSFLAWLFNQSLSEVWLCSQGLFMCTFFGQRVMFLPKLSRPHQLLWKASFPLELNDISVIRDIIDVFLEVSPCCHMTELSSSWVSWFSESLLLQETNWISWTSWLSLNNNLESWKTRALSDLILLKGMSSFVCVEVRKYLLYGYAIFPKYLIWVWAIVKSNSVPRTILMMFILMVFRVSTCSCPLVWPILLPCLCNIWYHLYGVSW
jgi:lysylphosphatidylglycerol synthetase-like protein (DUF2156 family)